MPIPGGSAVRYVTPEQVRDALAPDGVDPDNATAASDSDSALVDRIVEAADQVDAELGRRYTVPFTGTVPSLVVSLTRDIAAYLATLTFRRGDPVPSGDPVALRYDRALKLLADLSSGKAELPTDSGGEAETGQVEVVNPYEGDLFGVDDFAVGPDPGAVVGAGYFPSGSLWP